MITSPPRIPIGREAVLQNPYLADHGSLSARHPGIEIPRGVWGMCVSAGGKPDLGHGPAWVTVGSWGLGIRKFP